MFVDSVPLSAYYSKVYNIKVERFLVYTLHVLFYVATCQLHDGTGLVVIASTVGYVGNCAHLHNTVCSFTCD